jgi:hypothetical protein
MFPLSPYASAAAVTCAIICTDEHLHIDPIMAALERKIPLLIEKPLATRLDESAKVLKAIQQAGVDAVVGYTQRFRRRWLAAKEKCRTGALGDVTLVSSRAFMNRLVAIDNYKRTDDPATISPIFCLTRPNSAMGRSNWRRSVACLEAREMRRFIPPTQPPPSPVRPALRMRMAALKPLPNSPSTWSAGTRTSSSRTVVGFIMSCSTWMKWTR